MNSSPLTLVRIRGNLTFWLEVVGSIGDGFTRVYAGIGVANSEAFTAGSASLPGPLSDPEWGGWMWYEALGPIIGLSVTEADNTGPLSQVRVPIDTKAMRKLEANQTIFGMVQTATEVGVATLNFQMSTRMFSLLF